MTESSIELLAGTRVDCLYGEDYFRGTLGDAQGNNRYKVCFDDGDEREDVPAAEITLPLQTACRVECLFEVQYKRRARRSFCWRKVKVLSAIAFCRSPESKKRKIDGIDRCLRQPF